MPDGILYILIGIYLIMFSLIVIGLYELVLYLYNHVSIVVSVL